MTAAYLALLVLVGLGRFGELGFSRRCSGVCGGRGTIAPPPADSFAGNCDDSAVRFRECVEMVGDPDSGGTLERGSDGVFSRWCRDIRSVPVGPASELCCRGDRVVCLANDTHGLAHGTGRDTREPGDPAAKAACGRWRPDG